MELFKNMHLFVEVAKASSFRRAADVLGIPTQLSLVESLSSKVLLVYVFSIGAHVGLS